MDRIHPPFSGLFAIISAVILVACGGGGGGSGGAGPVATPSPVVERYAVVASYDKGTLASYAVQAGSGTMRLTDKFSSVTQATDVVLRPGHDEILALSAGGLVHHLQLGVDGSLSMISQLLAGGNQLQKLRVDPSGRWVYVANAEAGQGGIHQLWFDPEDGALTEMVPESFVEAGYADAAFVDLVIDKAAGHLYASDPEQGRIVHFRVGKQGALDYEGYVETGDTPYSLALRPGTPDLYVAHRFEGSLSHYRMLADGGLTPVGQALPVAEDVNLDARIESVVIDRSGRFLYASDPQSDRIWQFRINKEGGLVALAEPFVNTPEGVTPGALSASPVSDRVYLSDESGGSLLMFSFPKNGELTAMTPGWLATDPAPSAPVFSTGRPLTAHARAAYVINGNDDDISQFSINDAGTLAPLGDGNPSTGDYPVAIAAHPTGDYFYVANANDDTVSQFRRITSALGEYEADELAPIRTPVEVEQDPVALAVHPSGNFLYVLSRQNQRVSVYSLHTNGEIEDTNGLGPYLPDAPLLVDEAQVGVLEATALAIDPTGRFLWVVNDQQAGAIIPFRINTFDGSLSKIEGGLKAAGAHPRAVAASADGRTVYVSASGDSQIRSYAVAEDGTLSAGPTGNTGQGAIGLAVAPLSNVLYVMHQIDSSVAWFGADDVGSTASMGTAPSAMAVDPTGRHLLVTHLASNTLGRFDIADNGALSAGESVQTGIGPLGVAVSGFTD